MKKYFKVIFLFVITVFLSGCVKYNYTIKISDDKKVDMDLILAISSDIAGENTEEDDRKLETQGWKSEDFNDGDYVGKRYTKQYTSIDDLTSDSKVKVDLNEFVDSGEEVKTLFTKRNENGKDIYVASFDVDTSQVSSDGESDGMGSTDYSNLEVGVPKVSTDANGCEETVVKDAEGNVTTTTVCPDGTVSSQTVSADEINGLSVYGNEIMKAMDLKVIVEVPKVIKSNATSVEGNKLIWDLTKFKEKTIDFEFSLDSKGVGNRSTNNGGLPIIPIAIGGGILLVFIIVVVSLGKKKKGNTVGIPSSTTNVSGMSNVSSNQIMNSSASMVDSTSIDGKSVLNDGMQPGNPSIVSSSPAMGEVPIENGMQPGNPSIMSSSSADNVSPTDNHFNG